MDKLLLLHRVYKLFGRMHFFQTKYGIKVYNKPLFEGRITIKQNIVDLNPANLYLGFDGLNDQYTLVGRKISESPHYDLVKRIHDGKDISTCDYVNREKNGSLDGRYGIKMSDEAIRSHIENYRDSLQSVKHGTYSAATVYYANGRYYVLDGKHRLAMCLMLGKKSRCRVIDTVELAHDLYSIGLYREMRRYQDLYKKNLDQMRPFMESRTGSPRILVVNRNKTDNLGDQAIGYSMVRLFESFGADVDLAEFSNNQGKREIEIGTALKNEKTPKNISKSLKNRVKCIGFVQDLKWIIRNQNIFMPLRINKYDYVIIGGGELIQSNQVFPVAFETWVRKSKKLQPEIKLGIFSVGVTDTYSKNDFFHYRKALVKTDFAYVRDKASADNIKNLFGIKAKVIPDVVFSNTDNDCFASLNKECSLILYGITSYRRVNRYGILADSEENYYEKSYCAIREIKENNPELKIKLFFTTQSDYAACQGFAEFCKKKHGSDIEIEETDTLEKLLMAISNAKEIYSPRMHGCIIGNISGGGMTKAILLSPKMRNYERTYGGITDFSEIRKQVHAGAQDVIRGNS